MPRTTVPRALTRTTSALARAFVVPTGHSGSAAQAGRLLAPLALVLALVSGAATVLADRGFAVVHQCVEASGVWGAAGMHLALVHAAPDCPSGVALGGDPAAMVTVLGVLALPVLLAHGAVALLAWGMTASARRALGRAREVGSRVVRAVRRAAVAGRVVGAVRRVVRPVPDAVPPALHHVADVVVRSLRGPPRLVTA
ncbi:hypothetical protein IF650_10785 [Cellulosimicrobium terreum]|nr:hypothetical protein [Cellulosimicrobium terreum]